MELGALFVTLAFVIMGGLWLMEQVEKANKKKQL